MKKHIHYILCYILTFHIGLASAQLAEKMESVRTFDSLFNVLKTARTDAVKISVLNAIGSTYAKKDNYKLALQYAEQAEMLAKKNNDQNEIINAYITIGMAYRNLANYEKAFSISSKLLLLSEQTGNKNGLENAFLGIGIVYMNQGNYQRAYENYLKSFKISEEIGDKKTTATCYNNMGLIFKFQNNNEQALENYLKALKIRNEIGDKTGIAMCYNNIGNIYIDEHQFKKALDSHLKSLKIREETGNKYGVGTSLNNLGLIYSSQKNYQKALDYNLRSLKIRAEIGDKKGVGGSYNNIGDIYIVEKKFDKGLHYITMGLNLFTEINYKLGQKASYNSLSNLYYKKGDFKQAFNYRKFFSFIKDSLLNEQSGKEIAEMNSKYESEKKNKDIELLTKTKELQFMEVKKQKLIRNVFVGGLILALILAFVLFNRFVIKQKLSAALSTKNNELTQKNTLIENQNQKIIDSITYAQQIQKSILMEESEIHNYLPNSFVYCQPKDIVSGDFYWCSKINNKIIIAAIDCTGHGVPGAFMSMVANTLLNRIVNEKHITLPSEILKFLNIEVYNTLRQEKDDALSRDGMDIALCCIDYKKGELQYAGAQNPLYVLSDNELHVIEADRYGIGGGGMITKMFDTTKKEYMNHTIPLKENMKIYLFSDGYMDQFGGKDRKKFGIQNFKKLLLNNQHLSMEEFKKLIAISHSQWKADTIQTDDILVIGVKI